MEHRDMLTQGFVLSLYLYLCASVSLCSIKKKRMDFSAIHFLLVIISFNYPVGENQNTLNV